MNISSTIFKSKKNRLNPLFVLFFLSGIISLGAYELGKTSNEASERRKILVPFLLGLPSVVGVPILNDYIKKQVQEETKQEFKNYKDEITRINKQPTIDFMSFIDEKLTLNKVAWNPSLRNEEDTEDVFRNKLKESLIEFENSQEAINVLLRSDKDENGKERKLLNDIVTSALKETCKWKTEPEFRKKHDELYVYLRAWLICGMRYKTYELPIEWIKENSLSPQERIKALTYIRENLLNHKTLKFYLPNDNVRELIGKYLDNLIDKIAQK